MESILYLGSRLNDFFEIRDLEKDPGFSRFIPMVYDPIEFDWKSYFEKDFTTRFNGLMLKGTDHVQSVHLAVFPTEEVLETFTNESQPGDLLFMHHPLHMECGDPKGNWGRGFLPIRKDLLDKIKDKGLSVYTCHAPLDYNKQISTSLAIAEQLGAKVLEEFVPFANGYAGLICEMNTTTTSEIIDSLQSIFDIPYVDFEGKENDRIEKIAIVAGSGDEVTDMKIAEAKNVQAYITGEIHCHIDNEKGRRKFQTMMDYVPNTKMSLIGVSHASSEFLVMKTQLYTWFNDNFDVAVKLIPQNKWWR
ncbi:Nif3-like dinuclear metal center hexameric protein [Paenibacillus eucommiae]|uniref:GTP cyclohydrolase 1 type 2 homolog n=1 Tax=Paenibacillus eucommiae TaxID=1355755 RepID=A0ABS4JAQ3_9BACL|nr:Nif3-like dinuclear metal center hexameric protein [Paenibacillus eucommiae]MBP1996885.1 putative NIF3 family GTP cyclohydrolase 1 type 2 [Paenibacillus eucommiae]